MADPFSDHQLSTIEAGDAVYRTVVLRGSELSPVLPLFRDAFGRDFSADWLSRKYACSCGELAGFMCVAFTMDGEAAGSVGLLPWPVRFGDRKEVAGQMVDVATGSAHRGRGLFVRLADVVRERCEASGVDFLFGFPNDAAYPIWINKLDYEHVDDLVQYRRPIRTLWAERVAGRAGVLRRPYDAYVSRVIDRVAASEPVLENTILRDGFAGIDRDAGFYEYKSSFAGSSVVELGGGRVWLKLGHGLLVGDLEASSGADMDATIRELERLAVRLGAHQIVFQASKETRFSTLLAGRLEALPGLPVIYRNLSSQIPVEKVRYTFGDLDNF